jgi:hypothetical protein
METRAIDQPEKIFFLASATYKIPKNEYLFAITVSQTAASHPS